MMHELTIATSLMETVVSAAEKEHAGSIIQVDVEIGQLAGVMVDSLKFCFESIKDFTPLENTKLVIHEIPGMGVCSDCGKKSPLGSISYLCPLCKRFGIRITRGEEIRVRSIEVE